MTYETIITQEFEEKEKPVVCNHTEIYRVMSLYYKRRDEDQMYLITCDEDYHLKNIYLIHAGKIDKKTLDLKNILYKAIMDKACNISICHIRNVSSDALYPSAVEYSASKAILDAANIVGISVTGQIIIGASGYTVIKPNDEE